MKKITTLEMELVLSDHFGTRRNLIIPNVYWSFFNHEVDLLVLTPAGYAWEIEIKVSKADLKKDALKWHNHSDRKIKALWFALPEYLMDCVEFIPERAGIIKVTSDFAGNLNCEKFRNPKLNGSYKFSDKQRQNLTRLAALRIWTLKRRILKLSKKNS